MSHFLSPEEMETLILSLASSRGEKGFTEEEAEKLVAWAEESRLNASLLDLILEGAVLVDWKDGEIAVVEPEVH